MYVEQERGMIHTRPVGYNPQFVVDLAFRDVYKGTRAFVIRYLG